MHGGWRLECPLARNIQSVMSGPSYPTAVCWFHHRRPATTLQWGRWVLIYSCTTAYPLSQHPPPSSLRPLAIITTAINDRQQDPTSRRPPRNLKWGETITGPTYPAYTPFYQPNTPSPTLSITLPTTHTPQDAVAPQRCRLLGLVQPPQQRAQAR